MASIDLQLDLNDYKNMPDLQRRSGKDKCPEEIFMQTSLPPVVNSKNIQNNYEIAIDIEYGGMDCGVKRPHMHVPLAIMCNLHKHDAYH